MVQLSHTYMTTGKTIALLFRHLSAEWCLCFLEHCLGFHSFSSEDQTSCNFMAAVTIGSDFGAQESKICHCFHFFPVYLPCSVGLDAVILVFWMLSFKPSFSLSSFTFIKRLFSSSSLSVIRVVSSAFLRLLILSWQSWFQLVLHPGWHFAWCTLHIS